MSSILKVLLRCLPILRLVHEHIQKLPGRWISLLAVLSRKMSIFWHCHDGPGKPGTSRRPKLSESIVFGTRESGYPVALAHSPTSREHVTEASTVPESASYPNSQELAGGQTATAAPTTGIPLASQDSLSVDHSHAINPPPLFDGRILAHRGSENLSAVSIQSRASDRFLVITTSRESIRVIPIGQPSRLSRAIYRQFGYGPDPSRLRSLRDWSRPTPLTNRLNTPHQPPRLEAITSNAFHVAHEDDQVSSGNQRQPSPSSSTHEQLSPPSMNRSNKKQPSTSVVFDVQNSSIGSLPISSMTNPPPLTEGPSAIDPATAHSSPVPTLTDLHDEGPIRSSTSLSDYCLPEGRFVQLINSDQVPRYTKNVTMKVGYILIPCPPFYIS